MTAVIVRAGAACITLLAMLRITKAGAVKKNKAALIVSCVCLIIPAEMFDIHRMLIWCILMFHAYTDAAEHSVFNGITLAALAGEIIYAVIARSYAVQPLYTLLFPAFLICALKFIHAYAEGDVGILMLIMLCAYNTGHDAGRYMVCCLTFSMIFLVLYTGAANAVRAARHDETSRYGAMVPAIAIAYFLIEGLIILKGI